MKILEAAKKVFADKGYHGASVKDIIRKAKIARGTFYLYFTGKRHIFDCLLDSILEGIDQRVHTIRVGPGNPPPLLQLRGNVERALEVLLTDSNLAHILLNYAVGLDPESCQKLAVFYEKIADRIEESLRLGMRMGLVRPCRPRLTAYIILGCLKEVIASLSRRKEKHPPLRSIVDEILQFGLKGVYIPAVGDP